MENFFILREAQKEIPEVFFRDQEAEIYGNLLRYKEINIELPFKVLFFKHMPFDFFLVSTDQILYRINKYKKTIEEIGEIVDDLLSVTCRDDKIFILTDKEILMFNAYFDLEKSTTLDSVNQSIMKQYNQSVSEVFSISSIEQFNQKFKLVAGTDYFSLVGQTLMIIFDFKLNVTGVYFESVLDAVFFDNYNKFICSCPDSDNLKFIEPNGLEHGDPIEFSAQKLYSMTIDGSFIVLAINNDTITGLSMKNFFWYKKFEIKGELYKIEDNTILTRSNNSLKQFFIYKIISKNFVINGSELYYTNLARAIIPPPFYYKKIQLNSQICHFDFFENSLAIADTVGIHFYKISNDDQISHQKSILFIHMGISNPNIIQIVQYKSYAQLRTESGIYKIDYLSDFSVKSIGCPWMTSRLPEMLYSYNFGDVNYTLLQDGSLYSQCNQVVFKLNNKKGFNVQFKADKNEIYMLNDGKLQKASTPCLKDSSHKLEEKPLVAATSILNDIFSYLIYKNFLLYTQGHKLKIEDQDNINTFESYVDENTSILTVRDNSVVMFTRFGSLETETAKIFSRLIVEELITKKMYKEAASRCDHNHIDYSIFRKFCTSFDFLNEFTDSQALAFFNCQEFKNTKFYLEHELVDRLSQNFKREFVFKGEDYKCCYPFCISSNSTSHLFNQVMLYKQVQNKNCDPIPFLSCLPSIRKISDAQVTDSGILNDVASLNINNNCGYGTKSNTTNKCNINNKSNSCQSKGESCKLDSDIADSFKFINGFLSVLNLDKHFITIVNVFIALNRVDLCFYLPNTSKVVKVLLTRLSPESICKESIKTFDQDKIILVHKLCQRDFASFIDFFNSSENKMFSVFHFLEDKQSALFYLISDLLSKDQQKLSESSLESILNYSSKHNLLDTLAMFSYFNIFTHSFYNDIVTFYEDAESKFYLYKLDKNYNQAILTATENLLWKQALALDSSKENCVHFIRLLCQNSMFDEAGDILKFYLKDFISAIYFYLKSESLSKILSLYQTRDFSDDEIFDREVVPVRCEHLNKYILDELSPLTSKYITIFNELVQSYNKYKDRLQKVRTRLNENINASQTSFSYSSIKSSQKALIKDRPGGIFENEFVLNKIRELVIQINQIRIKSGCLSTMLSYLGQKAMSEEFNSYFTEFSSALREEIDVIWNFERVDLDLDFPKVDKPDLDKFYF